MISTTEQDIIPNASQLALLATLKRAQFPHSATSCRWVTQNDDIYLAIPYPNDKEAVRLKIGVVGFLCANKINQVTDNQATSDFLVKETSLDPFILTLKRDPKAWLDYHTIVNNITAQVINKAQFYCQEFMEFQGAPFISYQFSMQSAIDTLQTIFNKNLLKVGDSLQCSLQLKQLALLNSEQRAAIIKKLNAFYLKCDDLILRVKTLQNLCPLFHKKILHFKDYQVQIELTDEEARYLSPLLEYLEARPETDYYVINAAIFYSKDFLKNVKKCVAKCSKKNSLPQVASLEKGPLEHGVQVSNVSEDENRITTILSKTLDKMNAYNILEMKWETIKEKRVLLISTKVEIEMLFLTFLNCHHVSIEKKRKPSSFWFSKENAIRLSTLLVDDKQAFLNFQDIVELVPICLDRSSYISLHNYSSTDLTLELSRPKHSGLATLLDKPFTTSKGLETRLLSVNGRRVNAKFHQYVISLESLIRLPFKERLDIIISCKKFIASRDTLMERIENFFFLKLASLCEISKNIAVNEGLICIALQDKTALLIEPALQSLNTQQQGNTYLIPLETFEKSSDEDLQSLCAIVAKRIQNFETVTNLFKKIGMCNISLDFDNAQISGRTNQDGANFAKILAACGITFNYDMFFDLDSQLLAKLQTEIDKHLKMQHALRHAKISLTRALECWLPNRTAWIDEQDEFIATKVDPACALVLTKLAIPDLTIKNGESIAAVIRLRSLLTLTEVDFSNIQKSAETYKHKLQIMMSMIRCVKHSTKLKYPNAGCGFRYKNDEAKIYFEELCADLLIKDAEHTDQAVIAYEFVLAHEAEVLTSRLNKLEARFKQIPVENPAQTVAPAVSAPAPAPTKWPAQPKARSQDSHRKHKNTQKKVKKVTSTKSQPSATASQPVVLAKSAGSQISQQRERDFDIINRPSAGPAVDLEAFLTINPDQLELVPMLPVKQPRRAAVTALQTMQSHPLAQPEKIHEAAIQEELVNMRSFYEEWQAIPKETRQAKDIHYTIVCGALNLSLKRLLNAIHLRAQENPYCDQLSNNGDEIAWKLRNILMHDFPQLSDIKKLYKSLEQQEIGPVFNCIMNHRQPVKALSFRTYAQGFFHCRTEVNYQESILAILHTITAVFELYNNPDFKTFSKNTLIKKMQDCIVELGTLAKYLRLTQGLNNDIWKFVISCKDLRNDTAHNNINDESTGFDPLSPNIILQQALEGTTALKSWKLPATQKRKE